ncbi:hypothetical protein N0V94_007496 [Neodidymelliopsis sp. IMI 364377]|nr:hypothetical protein N0V94_007496 [Neodidymelliopsis sp. IMI 364377]
MSIPHEDPNIPFVVMVGFPKEQGLTWEDFHPVPKEGDQCRPLHQVDEESQPLWKHTANELHDLRTRFAKHVFRRNNPRCSTVDRSAVLAVYNEALSILEHASDIKADGIYDEVREKVEIILDLVQAEPYASAFNTGASYLTPLEPQYAHPRLDFYDRGEGDDSMYLLAYTRLNEWRKEGWPDVYPEQAVAREAEERRRRIAARRDSRLSDAEGLRRWYGKDAAEWGDEVDADPKRPWK